MSQDDSFDDWMGRLREGDDEAATRVFREFAQRLVELVQKRLGPRIRRKVDPEDVMQSVFKSFFRRQAAGKMADLETWDRMWGMLVVIAVRKCGRRVEYFRAARRDVQREVGHPFGDSPSSLDSLANDPEPSPAEEAMLNDLVQHLLTRLEGRHRDILTLSLQGHSIPEVSALVGCTERTVYRVLDRVKTWLIEMQDAEADE
jgi:RNA polymerase sigma-70 factor (ECF subfamily)